MPKVASTRTLSGTNPGVARNMPTTAVNTISATTRGLVSSKYTPACARKRRRRVEALEQAHVFAVDEDIEEARDAVSLEDAGLEGREAGDERLEGVADGCGVDRDGSLAACFGPEHGRDADLGHATSKDKALDLSLPRA